MESLGLNMFGGAYSGKKVLVTGHTGFKGSWLSSWLLQLGAKVCGISKEIPTNPSMFEELKIKNQIEHHFSDIRDYDSLKTIINSFEPDFVFHLAAQSIVSKSYSDPLETITTNVIGTAHVLEALRDLDRDCYAVIITSDKCYENMEWVWGYRETDNIGGRDIYSGSKGAAEIIFHAYQQSFFNDPGNKVRLATGRAGNVIGGGDWAKDRIVADCMIAWNEGGKVQVRCPQATRPWQHVLEPLSGYLALGQGLVEKQELHGQQFNFGPKAEQNRTVRGLLEDLCRSWDFKNPNDAYTVIDEIPFHEAGLLKLNCDKALFELKWEANLNYEECIKLVSEWYYSFYNKNENMFQLTIKQIDAYQKLAIKNKRNWAKYD